jgi:hypothetical protein
MEFLLPVFLKLFSNMLPCTIQDEMKEEVMTYDLSLFGLPGVLLI